MFLDIEKLKEITFGCIEIQKKKDGFLFSRFTEKQKEVWSLDWDIYEGIVPSKYFLVNCKTSANISLDFHTNSKSVEIDVSRLEFVNDTKNKVVEVFVNNKKRLAFEEAGAYRIALKGRSRVEILLPYYGDFCLKSIKLDDGAEVVPHKKGLKWLAHGDSITHGCIASGPSETYVARIARKHNLDIINHGNAGYVNDERIIDKIPDWEPDIVTTAYGINDIDRKKTREIYKNDLKNHCKMLQTTFKNAKIYIIAPIWAAFLYEKEENFARREDMYRIFFEVGDELNLSVIDGRKLVPHDRKYFNPDGAHPNDAGFRYYASRLARIIIGD